ncbi:MAG: class I SAM-dependent methyltransferase [Anaerolineaceae bacterium]|nr:class I SAM-dependent methyltransferase [Anaerolineaceae bacterium]
MKSELEQLFIQLEKALIQRKDLLDQTGHHTLRLFNGFLEGNPRWVIELFGKTLVINDHNKFNEIENQTVIEIRNQYLQWIPWVEAVLYKQRNTPQPNDRRGKIIHGGQLPKEILEEGVRYAINLTINQDSSFYLDTRYLRAWLIKNMGARTVLNFFAYTGSLGVAALAGGADLLIQTDLNKRFLELAKNSSELNSFSPKTSKYLVGDFYKTVAMLKRQGSLFDCVILDPPFFSSTDAGRVDLVNQSAQLINKVKPLIAHQGWLVVVNNALYLSGQSFLEMLEELCRDRYMEIETIIPVPQDVTGFPETIVTQPPVSTAPFNHSTKIVVLRVRRKDEKTVSLSL